jgi:hypothetical protein
MSDASPIESLVVKGHQRPISARNHSELLGFKREGLGARRVLPPVLARVLGASGSDSPRAL